MPPGSKTELCVHKITIMPRFNVKYDEVWREVSSVEFVNRTPSSEYDRDSVRGLTNLIQEALQVL